MGVWACPDCLLGRRPVSELGICVEVVVVREQGCEMTLTIKFGREKLAVELSTATQSLADLRKAIAEKTHLPPNSFKLIHAGAVMKDDAATLSTYKLHDKSTIVLIPSSPPPQPTTTAINAELSRVRNKLKPDVTSFVQGSAENAAKEHTRLSELLLQSLLALDGLDTAKMTDDARLERKAAVNEVQDLLDQLDGAWREQKPKA
ncbi:hypothetical protein PTI98_006184 [Pleurotus ostreatus]|nr:hypothetical protein PTI98_006184 [Pleurotus ostreatus]